MKLALIDYGSGNIHSVSRAIYHAAQQAEIPLELVLTDKPDNLMDADSIVLPGVGHFADCYQSVIKCTGLREAMEERVLHQNIPFLGICVGMQLLADCGREGGVQTDALGWIGGVVDKIPQPSSTSEKLKIPHMGWNTIRVTQTEHPVCKTLAAGAQGYFVHSFYYQDIAQDYVCAVSDYGVEIPAIIGKDNIIATQFHPEKSQQVGQQFLQAFLRWKPV